ncbi:hypothetical protein T492DRAFT_864558 [Pavlovales sp. CCMP2436]|nr:hypothetical protein T492DRAFT_864558 [Pavlovales sp. CCMP2436]
MCSALPSRRLRSTLVRVVVSLVLAGLATMGVKKHAKVGKSVASAVVGAELVGALGKHLGVQVVVAVDASYWAHKTKANHSPQPGDAERQCEHLMAMTRALRGTGAEVKLYMDATAYAKRRIVNGEKHPELLRLEEVEWGLRKEQEAKPGDSVLLAEHSKIVEKIAALKCCPWPAYKVWTAQLKEMDGVTIEKSPGESDLQIAAGVRDGAVHAMDTIDSDLIGDACGVPILLEYDSRAQRGLAVSIFELMLKLLLPTFFSHAVMVAVSSCDTFKAKLISACDVKPLAAIRAYPDGTPLLVAVVERLGISDMSGENSHVVGPLCAIPCVLRRYLSDEELARMLSAGIRKEQVTFFLDGRTLPCNADSTFEAPGPAACEEITEWAISRFELGVRTEEKGGDSLDGLHILGAVIEVDAAEDAADASKRARLAYAVQAEENCWVDKPRRDKNTTGPTHDSKCVVVPDAVPRQCGSDGSSMTVIAT